MDLTEMTYWDAVLLVLRAVWKIVVNYAPVVLWFLGYWVWEVWQEFRGPRRVQVLADIRRKAAEIRSIRWQTGGARRESGFRFRRVWEKQR